MGAMIKRVAFLLALCPTPSVADPVATWAPLIAQASTRFGVPAPWIERVIRAESGGRTMPAGRPIRSRAGAIGLMQLMPATWGAVRDTYRLGADPDDPRDNILAGTAYLRAMIDLFGYPGAFAAYNAGPARYDAYLAGKARLPSETIAYLGAVTGHAMPSADTSPIAPRDLLFALRRDMGEPGSPPLDRPQPDAMFAIRGAQR